MVINTNLPGQASAHNLQASQAELSKSLARLSSGSKIIDPADDAAGLAVSSRLDAQIARTNAARNNVGNAISFTQTQDGYLRKIAKALDRMSELSIMAQDVTKSDDDRALYNEEFTQLGSYITSAASKEFNGVSLFSSATLDVITDSEGNTFPMGGVDLGIATYTTATGSTIDTVANSVSALSAVKDAITQLAADRAMVGAYQVRMNHTAEQLMISAENLTAATSHIKDIDVAEESTQYARVNILVQSGTAMLAQANQMPQSVLKLLQ